MSIWNTGDNLAFRVTACSCDLNLKCTIEKLAYACSFEVEIYRV